MLEWVLCGVYHSIKLRNITWFNGVYGHGGGVLFANYLIR